MTEGEEFGLFHGRNPCPCHLINDIQDYDLDSGQVKQTHQQQFNACLLGIVFGFVFCSHFSEISERIFFQNHLFFRDKKFSNSQQLFLLNT